MQHFTDMVAVYTQRNPGWKNTRRGVIEFVLRAHNTVNNRNRSKLYTFEESLAELQRIIPDATAAKVRRQQYLVYVRSDWMKNMTLNGISSAPKLKELNIIEEEYWSKRSFVWTDIQIFADVNVNPIPAQSSNLASGSATVPKISMPARGGFSLKVGKLGSLSSLR
jgi:hypothetical protein